MEVIQVDVMEETGENKQSIWWYARDSTSNGITRQHNLARSRSEIWHLIPNDADSEKI
jgi:hypothetical protein